MTIQKGIAVAVAVLVLVACGKARESTPLAGEVTKASFEEAGLRWPLTVNQARLGCDGMALYVTVGDGTRYGLNGLASEEAGYAKVEPIWAVDEDTMKEFESVGGGGEVPTIRINIGDMIDEAQKQCS